MTKNEKIPLPTFFPNMPKPEVMEKIKTIHQEIKKTDQEEYQEVHNKNRVSVLSLIEEKLTKTITG